jgi:hypothetical protein
VALQAMLQSIYDGLGPPGTRFKNLSKTRPP